MRPPDSSPNPNQLPQPEGVAEQPQPATELPAHQPVSSPPAKTQPTVTADPQAQPADPQTYAAGPATATPALADDVDVIEREWVQAAEEVVKATKGEPHNEEEGFENLQVDYLHKRYGKDIKKPEGH